MTKKEIDLKGGVLIIGSLLWQDYLDKPGDDIRKNWRANCCQLLIKFRSEYQSGMAGFQKRARFIQWYFQMLANESRVQLS